MESICWKRPAMVTIAELWALISCISTPSSSVSMRSIASAGVAEAHNSERDKSEKVAANHYGPSWLAGG